MTVVLEFNNVIIPIRVIQECAAVGGLKGLIARNSSLIGEIEWYDAHLYRMGAMNRSTSTISLMSG